jgi:hypothetical protein
MFRRIGPLTFLLALFLSAPAHAQIIGETLSNFEAATTVIGQKNFTTGGCSFPGSRTLRDPYGEAIGNKTLFIDDADYNRVLGFHKVPKHSAAAAFALGQTKLTTTGFGTTQTTLSFPTAVAVRGHRRERKTFRERFQ